MEFRRGLISVFMLISLVLAVQAQVGSNNYYTRTCNKAESIVRRAVIDHLSKDRTMAAALVRLHFHDCFVNGCDGSILLDYAPPSAPSGTLTEKVAHPNINSVRGYDVIDDAKLQIEAECPDVVSCADIVAIAARDALYVAGGPYYEVELGRLDGKVSIKELAESNLPSPFDSVEKLISIFAKQGLSQEDMVVLSGAHTIGRAHCSVFAQRIYNLTTFEFGQTDPVFIQKLRHLCPENSTASLSTLVELDQYSPFNFDNSYYLNLMGGKGVLLSDQALYENKNTHPRVMYYANNPVEFSVAFALAMLKMGRIGWKTRENGEIRRICNMVES